MNQNHDRRWLSIVEAAEYIGMSTAFMRKQVRANSVPYTRIGTKALRFDRDALNHWLQIKGNGSI